MRFLFLLDLLDTLVPGAIFRIFTGLPEERILLPTEKAPDNIIDLFLGRGEEVETKTTDILGYLMKFLANQISGTVGPYHIITC